MPAARPAAQAPARPAPASRPLLVTVDDLPLAGAASRGDAAARRATTEALLAVLKKHRIPAIAFVIAGNVKTPDDEALLQRWLDEGHEIGSHSHTHPSYTALTSDAYLADVASSRTTLSAWLTPRQRTLRFFRFPYLQEGDTREKVEAIRAALAAGGLRNVPVTHRRAGLVVRSAVGRRRGRAATPRPSTTCGRTISPRSASRSRGRKRSPIGCSDGRRHRCC